MAEGHDLDRGFPPEIFGNRYALRCNLVHFETQLCQDREYLLCVHRSSLDDFSVIATYITLLSFYTEGFLPGLAQEHQSSYQPMRKSF